MWISRLSLRDYRSYRELDLEFEPGVTTFVADNGTGKTNIVEAIGYLAHLRSHRVAFDAPLVHENAQAATISALVNRGPRHAVVEVSIQSKGANRARVNRSAVRLREILGLVSCVVFAPEDLSLVRGEPAERRNWIDALVVARNPRYASVITDFERALKQRNALLKRLREDRDPGLEATLDIWNMAYADAASELVAGRRRLLADIVTGLQENFAYIAADARLERQGIQARYESRIDYSSAESAAECRELLLAALERRRTTEIERGLTLHGPGRDDLALTIGEHPAKGYASHGETWSLALAMQLAGWDLLSADAGSVAEQPILVLDDVFAELDTGRRSRLAARITEAEQVLITAAVDADLPAGLVGTRIDQSRLLREAEST
ncbi:DNA replication and repair protein RecF [Brevibacterium sanguinis]|uniref:DNA replication and repair protein RecF n=2 Tax=Brevibacterium TaxID=1696 RepID=A0A366IM09_9MICO|nr:MULTISPECIES: DNA replication/repair protein RecF [Brevibacterium]RBP67251.1 DNA replication and repair protein RecF [Brevibacterium sanguinis]RBP73776.1 DNA replication and repair protein RecF [Brevibacterium celere]